VRNGSSQRVRVPLGVSVNVSLFGELRERIIIVLDKDL